MWFDEEESRWTVDSDGDFVPPATTQPSVGDNIHAVFGHVQSLLDDVHVVGVHDWNVENIKQLIAGFDRFLATFEPLTASPQVRNRRAQIIGLLGALEALVHAYERSAQARRSNQRGCRPSPFAADSAAGDERDPSRQLGRLGVPASSSRRFVVRERLRPLTRRLTLHHRRKDWASV